MQRVCPRMAGFIRKGAGVGTVATTGGSWRCTWQAAIAIQAPRAHVAVGWWGGGGVVSQRRQRARALRAFRPSRVRHPRCVPTNALVVMWKNPESKCNQSHQSPPVQGHRRGTQAAKGSPSQRRVRDAGSGKSNEITSPLGRYFYYFILFYSAHVTGEAAAALPPLVWQLTVCV